MRSRSDHFDHDTTATNQPATCASCAMNDYFCSVAQYELSDYQQHVPVPSCVKLDRCIKDALYSCSAEAAAEPALPQPSCPTIAVTHVTDANSPVPTAATEAPAEPETLPRAKFIDEFFADVGDSPYPIYGHRGAAERLVAVREALAASHATPHTRRYVSTPAANQVATAKRTATNTATNVTGAAESGEPMSRTAADRPHTPPHSDVAASAALADLARGNTPCAVTQELSAQQPDTQQHPLQRWPNQNAILETSEQYWRRLTRDYIQLGMLSSCCATSAAGTTQSGPSYEPYDAFYLVDLGSVITQMCRWRRALPMVRPFYAVKCNPNLAILRVLSALGAGFDCASKEEIRLVMEHSLVATPDDIIFANPCKQLGDLRVAHDFGVTYVTFDNALELHKIAKAMPHARSVIRIRTDDGAARCSFSSKFGAPLSEVESLLRTARSLDVEIYGVSFHVGSGNSDVSAYVSAVRNAREVFDLAARYGFNCTLLDIGGGYPGMQNDEPPSPAPHKDADASSAMLGSLNDYAVAAHEGSCVTTTASASLVACDATGADSPTSANSSCAAASSSSSSAVSHTVASSEVVFDEIAAVLRPVLEELFPDTTIISEPGRFFSAAAMTLAMNVFARRTVRMSDLEKARCRRAFPTVSLDSADVYQYYVNDGLYHSFNCILYDHAHPKLLLLDDGDGAEQRQAVGGASGPDEIAESVGDGQQSEDCSCVSSSAVTTSSVDMIGDPWRRRRECARRPLRISTIFGPTCDSLDCILKTRPFPEMIPGDWVIALDMGSYTSAAGSAFNGFVTKRIEYVTSVLLN